MGGFEAEGPMMVKSLICAFERPAAFFFSCLINASLYLCQGDR